MHVYANVTTNFKTLKPPPYIYIIIILWVVYPVRLSRPPDTVLVSPRLRYPIMTPGCISPPCLATGPIDCFGAPYVVATVPRVRVPLWQPSGAITPLLDPTVR